LKGLRLVLASRAESLHTPAVTDGKARQVLQLSGDDQSPARTEPQTFYRYEGKNGKVVIVDSLSKLPEDARPHAERLELGSRQPLESPAAVPTLGGQAVLGIPRDPSRGDEVGRDPGTGATRATAAAQAGTTRAADPTPTSLPSSQPEWASFGLGLGAGLLLAFGASLLAGRGDGGFQRWAIRSTLFVGVLLVCVSGYLGWTRRHAGLDGPLLASPQSLIQDARGAVEQVEQRRLAREQELEELKRLAK
jgi:hypothetical protein